MTVLPARRIVNGHYYYADTPQEVIDLFEELVDTDRIVSVTVRYGTFTGYLRTWSSRVCLKVYLDRPGQYTFHSTYIHRITEGNRVLYERPDPTRPGEASR